MRNFKQHLKLMTTTLLLAASVLGIQAGGQKKYATVTIYRVAEVDNLDHDLPWRDDRADFYAQIWIDGHYHKTRVMAKNDGKPYWTFTAPVNSSTANIRIKLLDDDGGLERKDDYVDINPMNNKKDLDLKVNINNGRILGDAAGQKGQTLFCAGGGDSSKGQIWFAIT